MIASDILHGACVLIVDDKRPNVVLLERLLAHSGCDCVVSTTDPREVPDLFVRRSPDIVLLDLHMPHLDGYALLERLTPLIGEDDLVPLLVLTADATRAAKERALTLGAHDFITKPFDHSEVLLRIRNQLRTRTLHRALKEQNQNLEERVKKRTEDVEEARLETLERLALAAEYRDDDTGEHTRRVGVMAGAIASALGLPQDEVESITRAAPLHDVGKIGIPDGILLKPGKLTAAEFERVKTHTRIGAQILSGSTSATLQLAEIIALTHHERWDGAGYPEGLSGASIPVPGRIVAVADVYDALTNERPYKEAWPVSEALEEIKAQAGRQFDPEAVAAFLRIYERGEARVFGPHSSDRLRAI